MTVTHVRPLLSIVTVCRNAAATIADTFASVRAQRSRWIEYVVVDGDSDDGTLELIRREAGTIDVWVSEPDRGIFDAMNKGARLARGRFLWFLNADDRLEPGAVEAVVERLRDGGDPPGGLVVGATQRIDARGEPTVIDRYRPPGSDRCEPAHAFPHPSTIMSRELFERLGGFDPRLRIAGDYDLLWRAARLTPSVVMIERVLVAMREGGMSSSSAPLRVRARHELEVFAIQARNAGFSAAVGCHLMRVRRVFGRELAGALGSRPTGQSVGDVDAEQASQDAAPTLREWLRDIRRLWSQLAARRRMQSLSLLALTTVAAFAEVAAIAAALPFLVALATPELILGHSNLGPWLQAAGVTESADVRTAASITFAVAALVSGVIRIVLSRCTTAWTFGVGAEFDAAMFRRTMYQPYSVHVARHSSEVIAGVTSRSDTLVHYVLMPCLLLVTTLMTMTIVVAALIAWRPLAVLSAFGGFFAIYAVVAVLSRRPFNANGAVVAGTSGRVIRLLQEGLGGIRDVLIDGTQAHYSRRFAEESLRLRSAQGAMQFLGTMPRFGIEALGLALIAGLAWTMTRESSGLNGALATIGALAFSAQRVLPMLQECYWAYTRLTGAHPTLISVLDLLEQPAPDENAATLVEPLPFCAALRLEHVGFRYGPAAPWVLRNVSLEIPRGARIGIVGASGCGKSTLLDLIIGLQQPTEGRLALDGVTLDDANRAGWRAHIAQVPQSIHLADCSIEENIAFGVPKRDIDPQRVREAARKARIAETVEAMPDGYLSRVGENGVRLSGGQRQRIGIARALYKRADVLVLDEATSALDNETESEVIDTIEALGREITVIMVAHRLTTLGRCDRIVRLAGGRVESIQERVAQPAPLHATA
jgi:ATP-binding cassette subfamily B protein